MELFLDQGGEVAFILDPERGGGGGFFFHFSNF